MLQQALDTDPGPCLPGLPWVTQTMARGALQLAIYPKYHVSGASGPGRAGMVFQSLLWSQSDSAHQTLCGFKLGPRQIDQAIKHPTVSSLRESTAPSGYPTARPVPAYRLDNFPKHQSIPALDTDPGPCLPGLPWVTQTMARGALQLAIYPKYHVSGASWTGRHGVSVITLVPV